MSEEPRKDPNEVDPEKLLAELEARRLAFRDTTDRNSRLYRNLGLAVVLLVALAFFALWLLQAMLDDGAAAKPSKPKQRPAKEATSRLPSTLQPFKMPVCGGKARLSSHNVF